MYLLHALSYELQLIVYTNETIKGLHFSHGLIIDLLLVGCISCRSHCRSAGADFTGAAGADGAGVGGAAVSYAQRS